MSKEPIGAEDSRLVEELILEPRSLNSGFLAKPKAFFLISGDLLKKMKWLRSYQVLPGSLRASRSSPVPSPSQKCSEAKCRMCFVCEQ